MPSSSLVTVATAARLLSVSPKTVRRWDDKLKPVRGGNGYRLYDREMLKQHLRPASERHRGKLDRLYLGSCERMALPARSVHLAFTSPPYPRRYRPSGNMIPVDDWIDWLMPKIVEIRRVLRPDGSLVTVVKEPVIDGERHLVVYEFIRRMKDEGWRFVDELIWVKTNPLPRRADGRLKDAYERILHFTLSKRYSFHPEHVKRPLKDWHGNGRPQRTSVGGFRVVSGNFAGLDGALPPNVIECAHISQNLLHDAVHPIEFAEFLIRLLTREGDVVLDPFAGSGTTLLAARKLNRRWVGYENRRSAFHAAMARLEHEREARRTE